MMFFNQTSPTAALTEVDNTTSSSNEIDEKISSKNPAEKVGFTTSTVKVRVGNTLNVVVDSSSQSKYHNVEEDDAAVSVYPEHQMNRGVTELHNMPLQGQAESIETSSRSLYKGMQHSGDKAKSPAELTQVISDIIKAHKSEELEVIPAPNMDFSKQGPINVKATPSNSFELFSSESLDKHGMSKQGTVSMTEPPVDIVPWDSMESTTEDPSFPDQNFAEFDGRNVTSSGTLSSTESYESQTALTIQNEPTVPSRETAEHPEEPEFHSSFRIVPFLEEDTIFRSSILTKPPVISSSTGAYPGKVNTDTRDTSEDNCFVDGHLYFNGEVIDNGNLCEVCRCYYGRELCKQESCPLPPSRACISEATPGFCCPRYTCRK
ncbi:hypothetical protein HPB51_021338 [Rhipicephalus microplus]|uniref:VWFC domain-containing protein n=1 Tax=Rhipicephalus microplus TaxID=6941 RepID=A0A9J6F664_RHIMP|nr:hypothetical protein HPB51_021338 [Rhipicephalus microplus]